MLAAEYGHHKIAKLLIRRGANLNLQNKWERTALMIAAWRVHISITRDLLEAGADRDIKDDKNVSAIQEAHRRGCKEIVKILERGIIKKDDEIAGNAVQEATEAGCPIVVSDLLARGASMDTKNKK